MTTSSNLDGLLARVEEATTALRSAEGVPHDVERLVDGLAELLHADAPGSLAIDPYLATTLFAGALRAAKAVRHEDDRARRGELRVALEQVRQALRDVADGRAVDADRPGKDVVRHLVSTVEVPQAEVAALLGVSLRQLQRWLDPAGPSPTADDEGRARVVAQVVDHLRWTFPGSGAIRWFARPHPALDGATPASLLDDPLDGPRVIELAAASRTQGA